MSEFAITVFQMRNDRGLRVPGLNISYLEEDTGIKWYMSCGGTRAYFVRVANPPLSQPLDAREQAPDSHFMVRRLSAALLLGGAGLFQATVSGRVLIENVQGNIVWHCTMEPFQQAENVEQVESWYTAIVHNTFLRRASEDVHTALCLPHEAFVYIYRGFEWIVKGFDLSWEDLAHSLDVPPSHLKKDLKKMANYETGVRHASESGMRMRANYENYATWVAGLVDAINIARGRIEPDFEKMSADEIAVAVGVAAPQPFP